MVCCGRNRMWTTAFAVVVSVAGIGLGCSQCVGAADISEPVPAAKEAEDAKAFSTDVTASGGNVLVVDNQHPAAKDTNPGSEAMPLKTVEAAAKKIKPGGTVYVMSGTYDERVTLTRGNSGQAGKIVTFRAVPRRSVTMQGFDLSNVTHVRIEGFNIASSGQGLSSIAVLHGGNIEVIDNHMSDCASPYGAVRLNHAEPWPAHVRIAYNKIYKSQKGMVVFGNDCLVECNEVERLYAWIKSDCDYSRAFGRNNTFRRNFFHGTKASEVGTAHVDGIQTWHINKEYEHTHQLTVEENVFLNVLQGIMARGTEPGFLSGFTLRNNILGSGIREEGAAWGTCLMNVHDVTAENNLFLDIVHYGFRIQNQGSATLRNNIFYRCRTGYSVVKEGVIKGSHNLVNAEVALPLDATDITEDPLFADDRLGNYRLKKESPCIDANEDGRDIGPFEYPNVYIVDGRHPAATDEGYGYPAIPFKTLGRAVAAVGPGETIVVRAGVYREFVKPETGGFTIRAEAHAKPVISGADLIAEWRRDGDKWTAPLVAKPIKVLKDGGPWTDYTWNDASKTITVAGFDPRLHVLETVVRSKGIDLSQAKGVRVEGIEVADMLTD